MQQTPRVALVTGAASGIGRATCVRLAADGWDVAGVDRDADGLAATGPLVEVAGRRWHAGVLDLLSPALLGDGPDGLDAVLAGAVAALGPLDLVVGCAGIGVAATVVDTDPADWDRVLAVNLTGAFHLSRAVLPAMLERGGGNIVHVASMAAVVGVRNRAAYCASKAGLVGLVRAIAVDHAHQGIRCNAICPGTVATEWIGKILADSPDPDATRAAMAARQLDGRMGTPEEVAAGIAFLASDDGRFVNGSAWLMDGGATAL